MRHNKIFKISLLFLLIFGNLLKANEITDTMKNYCTVPPFMEVDTKPTILLIQDFSGSMQFQAYYRFYYRSPYYIRNKVYIFNGYQRADITYDKTKSYYGYFKANKYYKYDATNGYWVENPDCEVSGNDVNVGNSKNCISGNILNFVATSRIDVALKSLTGGKTGECGKNNDELCLVNRGAFRYVHDTTTGCDFKIEPNKYWNNQNQYNRRDYDMKISITGEDSCKIKGISNAWLRIKIDPSEKVGILQKNADIGDFALMVFASNSRYGEIRAGVNDYRANGMDYLVEKLDSELPWYGTPTGEALREAYDYLRQSNSHSYESNSNYIDKDSEKDPFYDADLGKTIACKRQVIILISDGEWNGSVDPDGVSKTLHTTDLRTDLIGKQNALIFTLFTFANSEHGKNAMRTVAAAGTFNDLDGNNNPFDIDTNNNSLYISYPRPSCNPSGTYDDKCKEWDSNRDGEPDGYFYASNGEDLENAMKTIFTAIKKYSYSGGAVAVLGKKDNESSATGVALKGSVLTQSLFFTQKYGINWVGKVYGYWYNLIDGTIREDTDGNKILNYSIDKILEFVLENEKTLVINRYNVKPDGSKDKLDTQLYDTDSINYLFETGYNLWANFNESNTDTDDDRKIYYAACEKGESCLKEFKYNSLSDFMLEKSYGSDVFRIPLLGFPGECFNMCNYFDNMTSFDFIGIWKKFLQCLNDNNDYDKLIKYIRGKDFAGWRNRTTGGKVWKLGDIIHSSPKIVHYRDKNVIIVGANDGMLHVFKLGKSTEMGLTGKNLVKLEGENVGEELWAFIPLNMLPYLRFLADPNYCHTYYVDSSVYVFDTKDGKKILIGSMRLGGGTGDDTNTSNKKYKPVNPPKWACPTTLWDFMKEQCESCADNFSFFNFMCSWIPSSPPDFSHCIGLSSYFAIDITDIEKPKFLWEFSHPDLGFAYSGPAVIEKKDSNNNYKTYIMFGSGPTNYYGNSNQKLKFFVVNLDGSNVNSPYILDTNIRNAFSGRLFTKGFDVNKDGLTDYVFAGYGRRDGNMQNWKGGLLMIDVRDDSPSNWVINKYLVDSQGPITAKVEVGGCFGKYYVYLGTGKWFYKADNPLSGQKGRLYGIPLRCNINTAKCTPILSLSDNSRNVCRDAQNGVIRAWYVELDLGNNDYYKERDITDPLITGQNVVLFTTIEPTKDPCLFGGRTRIWALNCATGGSLVDNCPVYNIDLTKLKGSALLQLSGGDIQQINLQQIAQEQQSTNSKHTKWYTGTAPEGAPSFVTPLPPKTGELLLWLEK